MNKHGVTIVGGWLTVNRNCNFRCGWCYAKGTRYKPEDTMALDLALNLVELMAEVGIQKVIILGGEPTLWKHLFPVSEKINKLGMKSVLVTNGFRLADQKFLARLRDSPINAINISLKAGNETQFVRCTKSNVSLWGMVLDGIRALSDLQKDSGISITVNSTNIDNLDELVGTAMLNGARHIGITFCSVSFDKMEPVTDYIVEPLKLVNIVERVYPKLHDLTNGSLTIEISLPMCLWSNSFIETLVSRNQIITGCHVLSRNGLIFDPLGNIILCNCLSNIPVGKYGKDFDTSSFWEYWNSPEVLELNERLVAFPSNLCISCNKYGSCGGGCPLQWFVYNPKDYIRKKESEK